MIKRTTYLQFGRVLAGICLYTLVFTHQNIAQTLPYQNPKLSNDKRVQDLLQRMTLEEKIAQMCQFVGPEHMKRAQRNMSVKDMKKSDAYGFYPGLNEHDVERMVETGLIGSFLHVVTAAEADHLQRLAMKSRLKIPLLIGIDAIHGNGMVSGCTIYPSPISLSCSWDTVLAKQIAKQTAEEMVATGSRWAFSPNLDITRDPRWGRTGETYGEDPYLVTQMGVATINGLQQNGVLACAKHLIAGSEPVNGLNKAPTDVSERTLNEIYLPPYIAAVKAGVATIMPAHNEINGIPGHSNRYLMNDVMRKKLGFNGFYISDWMDIEQLQNLHKISATPKEAVYESVYAGMDMHMHGPGFMEPLLELVKEKRIPLSRIDEAVSKILYTKFQVGLFEAPLSKPTFTPQQREQHRQSALDAARKSIVLLKNNGILPLQAGKYKNVLVVGPNANNQSPLGDWSLKQPDENVVTVFDGIKHTAPAGSKVTFSDAGRFIPQMQASRIDSVVDSAKNADLIIVVVGDNSLRFEGNKRTAGENTDRDAITLPGLQQQLVEALHQTGKPVVAVLINGRPLAIPWLDENLPAIIEAWEPGEQGGQAIGDILWGKVNPQGKLTVTIPRNIGQIGNYYNHKPSQYALHYIGSQTGPLYPFGFGLSYTTYRYSDFKVSSASIKAGKSVSVSVRITNTGKLAGTEIAQLYLHSPSTKVTRPIKELKGFSAVYLQPGESKTITFTLNAEAFENFDINMQKNIDPGSYELMVGGSSKDEDLLRTSVTISQ